MAKVIAIANQKGGTGKTTTCANLGIGLANAGKKVMLIDWDSQANLTTCFGINPDLLEHTIGTVLSDRISGAACDYNLAVIEPSIPSFSNDAVSGKLHLIPSDINLFRLESMLSSGQVIKREEQLKRFVNTIKADYDYILIDCMPSLGIMTTNALTAADEVLIPMQAQYLSGKGREQLFQSIGMVKDEELNPNLKINGILFTMVDRRANHPKELMAATVKDCGKDCFIYNNPIPHSIKVAEYQQKNACIMTLINNPVALAYTGFVHEFLSREEK